MFKKQQQPQHPNQHEQMKKSKIALKRANLLAELDKEDENIPPNPNDEEFPAEGKFETLFKETISNQTLGVGDVTKGRIIRVDNDVVIVDVNFKSEGIIPKSEFQGAKGLADIDVGQEIDVYVESLENDNGMIVLSKDRADIISKWKDISEFAKTQKIIEGTVIMKVKGGLQVDIGGVKAFLPGSQIELRSTRNLDPYVGQTYDFKIIKFNEKRGNIVLSRRVILQEKKESLRGQNIEGMEKGAVVSGIVKNVTDYGAFIDLGGMDGLLHIADISWSRIKHPSEKLSIGQSIDVKILKYDKEKNRVSLGLKQLNESDNPWEKVKKELNLGDKVKGHIKSLTDYGAFVAIDSGVEGLVHISEMNWGKKPKSPSDVLQVGQEVDLKVIDMDHEHQRISFSIKRLQENPWNKVIEKYPKGNQIDVIIDSVTDYAIFIHFEEDPEIKGVVRIADTSWSNRTHLKGKYSSEDKLRVLILDFNSEEEKFQLGIKQLQENPWNQVETLYPIGSVHKVKVIRVVDFGAFVEIGDIGVEGLIHISELTTDRVSNVEDVVKLGDIIEAEIITLDKDSQKIGFSSKQVRLRSESKVSENKEENFFSKALRASISKKKDEKVEPSNSEEGDKNE